VCTVQFRLAMLLRRTIVAYGFEPFAWFIYTQCGKLS
jgi:hypothetical protein